MVPVLNRGNRPWPKPLRGCDYPVYRGPVYGMLEHHATLTRMACVSKDVRATMFAAVEQRCSVCTNQDYPMCIK